MHICNNHNHQIKNILPSELSYFFPGFKESKFPVAYNVFPEYNCKILLKIREDFIYCTLNEKTRTNDIRRMKKAFLNSTV